MDMQFYSTFFAWAITIVIPIFAVFLVSAIIMLFVWAIGSAFGNKHIDNISKICFYISLVFFAPMGYGLFNEIHADMFNEKQLVKVIDKETIERFTLVEFDPPKHVYISLKHNKTGSVYNKLYVSKHCGTYPKLHDEYNVRVVEYHYKHDPSTKYWDFKELSYTFCGA